MHWHPSLLSIFPLSVAAMAVADVQTDSSPTGETYGAAVGTSALCCVCLAPTDMTYMWRQPEAHSADEKRGGVSEMAFGMFRKPMESHSSVVEHYHSMNGHDDLRLYADAGM
jgi:hypothetical protein